MLKSQALQLLDEKIAACTKCGDLTEYRRANAYKTVPGVGNPSARIFVLGEAPGENEAKDGLPFVGRAGNLLTNVLAAAGLRRDEVFIANVLKCRPPGNRDPEPAEAANCRKFLDLQLRVVDPEWVVCFGRVAAVNLMGLDPDTTVGSLRHRVHEWDGRKVICTYHPSYVLRQQDEDERQKAKASIWADLQPLISDLRTPAASVQ